MLGRQYDLRLTGATGFNQLLEIMNRAIYESAKRKFVMTCFASVIDPRMESRRADRSAIMRATLATARDAACELLQHGTYSACAC